MGGCRVSPKAWRWCVLIGAALVPACAVDNRQLTTERTTANMGGAGSAGWGSCGAAQVCDPPDGGDSGVTSADSGAVPCVTGLCPDLNGNNVPDSAETLVLNPTFNSDINDWDPETGVGLGWNGSDACGHCDSGSIAVTNQFAGTSGDILVNGASQSGEDIAVGGARQCIQANPKRLYTIMGRAKPATDSFGGLGLEFFAAADCSGNSLSVINSSFIESADSVWHWQAVSGVARDATQSVALRLIVAAAAPPTGGNYANVLFDNILVLSK